MRCKSLSDVSRRDMIKLADDILDTNTYITFKEVVYQDLLDLAHVKRGDMLIMLPLDIYPELAFLKNIYILEGKTRCFTIVETDAVDEALKMLKNALNEIAGI